MNKENNKRYQDTEKKIVDSYSNLAREKPISKITVSDICRQAHIHRTTFYGHYEDMPALLNRMELLQLQVFMDSFYQNGSWNTREGILKQLTFFYHNKKIVKKHLMTEKTSYVRELFFQQKLSPHLYEQYRSHFHCGDDTEFHYHQIFFRAGCSAILSDWILSDCRESPEKIADILMKIYG